MCDNPAEMCQRSISTDDLQSCFPLNGDGFQVRSLHDLSIAVHRIRESYPGANILFRGQANSSWALESTLWRASQAKYRFDNYLKQVEAVRKIVQTYSGKSWEPLDFNEMTDFINTSSVGELRRLPLYGLMVYLRHHGYPSPLVDWTKSPFVASYFSCAGADDTDSAIFIFIETPLGFKVGIKRGPRIVSLGPSVVSHPRHFRQQAEYTFACEYSNDCWSFCSHQSVNFGKDQDILLKITIPHEARRGLLKALDEFNVNEFTLFDSEDAMVRTIAFRDFGK